MKTILLLSVLALSRMSYGAEAPQLMAALGDSITAAALASVPLPASRAQSVEERVKDWESESLRPEVVSENKRTLSWASGQLIRSHHVYLREHLLQIGDPRPLEILNVAENGNKADDIPAQATKVAAAMAAGIYSRLAYVTLFIGSNDACANGPDGTPNETMRAHLLQAFETLAGIQQQDRIPVLVAGLVNIPDLNQPKITQRRTVFGESCETVRDGILRFCNPLLSWRTEAEYQRANEIVLGKNRLLGEVSAEASARFPNLQIFYTPVLHAIAIEPFMLAADCFHPASSGQQIISDALWDAQPFFSALRTSR